MGYVWDITHLHPSTTFPFSKNPGAMMDVPLLQGEGIHLPHVQGIDGWLDQHVVVIASGIAGKIGMQPIGLYVYAYVCIYIYSVPTLYSYKSTCPNL